jgi:hypothetical protein
LQEIHISNISEQESDYGHRLVYLFLHF